jgi:adenylate cyclase
VVGGVSVQDLSRFLRDLRGSVGEHAFILYGDRFVLAHAELVDRVQDFSDARRHGLPALPTLDSLSDPVARGIWSEVDPQGRPAQEGRRPDRTAAPPDLRLQDRNGGPGLEVREAYVGPDRTPYFYLMRRLGDYGVQPWTLAIAFETDTIEAELRRLYRLIMAGFAILVVSVLLSLLLGRGISRQIKRLAGAAVALRELDFRRVPELPDSRFHEIAEAAAAFNTMVGGLRWFETYVPKALVLRLIRRDRGRGGVESEERAVTVMFTDIKGFSTLAESMSPAETAALLNAHFDRIAACIEAEGGTVDKFIGDAVKAFWGAPEQQDDHAARALRAARAIVAVVDEEARAAEAAGHPAISLRIGIHSGPVVVGNIGASSRINYTIVGDTVNAAARLEALGDALPGAEPSVVLASADTVAAAGDCGVTLVRVGDFALRGRATPVSVWRLLTAGVAIAATLPETAAG